MVRSTILLNIYKWGVVVFKKMVMVRLLMHLLQKPVQERL